MEGTFPGMDGLYLSNAAQVLLQTGKTQNALETSVKRLSSGLRISSAADDPSGLAVAENLSSKASGFERSAENVQDANNALSIADGALQTVTDILQRVRSLIVQSNSDITSENDRKSIQAEIDQALKEINTISQNTQFNGRHLLDGSLDNAQAQPTQVREIPGDTNASGNLQTTVVNADGLGNPGPLVSGVTAGSTLAVSPITFKITVTDYSQSPIDPLTGVPVVDPSTGNPVPGFTVHLSAYSKDPGFGPEQDQISVFPITGFLPQSGSVNYPSFPGTALTFTISNLTPSDVGASQAFITTQAVAAKTGAPLNIHDGANEGATTAITIAGVSTSDLAINDVSVLSPISIDPTTGILTQSTSNALAATDAEYRVDAAITQITGERAQIGAQITALTSDANNDTISETNLRAAESNIRDTNIGSEVTTLTRNQILSTYQKTLLTQTTAISQLILRLVS